MLAIDLLTTEELLAEVFKRQEAKEITFLYALSSDDGEGWYIDHNFDDEQIEDLCQLLKGDESWGIEDVEEF